MRAIRSTISTLLQDATHCCSFRSGKICRQKIYVSNCVLMFHFSPGSGSLLLLHRRKPAIESRRRQNQHYGIDIRTGEKHVQRWRTAMFPILSVSRKCRIFLARPFRILIARKFKGESAPLLQVRRLRLHRALHLWPTRASHPGKVPKGMLTRATIFCHFSWFDTLCFSGEIPSWPSREI